MALIRPTIRSALPLLALLLMAATFASGPARGWDRGVKARKQLRAADRLFNARNFRQALVHYRAYIASDPGLAGEPAEVARAQEQLAECAEKAGRYAEAFDARTRALTYHLQQDDREATSRTVLRMSRDMAFLGRYDESLRLIGLAQNVPGAVATGEKRAVALRSMAVSQGAMGRYEEQRCSAEEAAALYHKLGDAAGEAACLNIVAVHHRTQGKFEVAMKRAKEALAIARRADHPDLAPILLTTASIHRARGDLRQAIALDQEALATAKDSGVLEALAVAQTNLGLDHLAFGERDKASRAFKSSLGIFEEAGAADDRARLHVELGKIAYLNRDPFTAKDQFQKAISLYESSGQAVGIAVARSGLGKVLLDEKQASQALGQYDRALRAYSAAGEATGVAAATVNRGFALTALGRTGEALRAFEGPAADRGDADTAWRARHGRARALKDAGRTDASIKAYRDAIERIERMLAQSRIPEFRSSLLAGADRLTVYDEAIELLISGNRLQEAFTLSERARARAFVDLVSTGRIDFREGVRTELIEEERALGARIRDVSNKLARRSTAAVTGAERGQADRLDRRLRSLRQERHQLLERIASESPQLARLVSVRSDDLQTAQSSLRPGEMLLLYHLGLKRARAFLLSPTSLTQTPLPLEVSKIRGLVERARIQYDRKIPNDETSRALYQALIAPIDERLKGRRLIIAPHDVLHYLPFQALVDEEGKYLIERFPITYVPSATALAAIGQKSASGAGRLLALGSPATTRSVPDLPFATSEVQGIARHFQNAQVLMGAAATEAELKRRASDQDILHFACHGELDPALPLYSGLALAPGDGEDGQLELHEIFGLDLRAELAVLSACKTAVGRFSRGDELVCLARSFLYSGCRSVLASLWSVPDESTGILMGHFYEQIAQGKPRDEALRASALKMIRTGRHHQPYKWAAFCLMGRYD